MSASRVLRGRGIVKEQVIFSSPWWLLGYYEL